MDLAPELEILEPVPPGPAVNLRRRGKPWLAPKPHCKIADYALEVLGPTAADAINAITNPKNALHLSIRRRCLDMLFPRERPVPLGIPDIESPESYNQALKTVHEAWSSGRVSPDEARQVMDLCERRYAGWLKARMGAGIK